MTFLDNQFAFVEWFAEEFRITNEDDWYKVSIQDFVDYGGYQLLKIHGSLPKLLQTVYPSKDWHFWKFTQQSKDIWDNQTHQRQFFDWISKELNISNNDWIDIKKSQIIELGGGFVLNQYFQGDLSKALQTIYPEKSFQSFKLENVSEVSIWDDLSKQRELFDRLGIQLGVATMEDWYQVKPSDLTSKARTILEECYDGILYRALSSIYPNFQWKFWKFSFVPRSLWSDPKLQRYLFDFTLFP